MAWGPDGQRCAVIALLACALAGCGSATPSKPVPPPAAAQHSPTRSATPPATELPSAGAQQAAVTHYAGVRRPIYCGGRHGNLVALTFDDGPGPYTRLALRELGAAGARATFFLVGASIARYPKWPARERALAAIGDHTMTHPDLSSLPLHVAVAEVRDGRNAAIAAAGPPVDLFRPPEGRHSDAIDEQVGRDGMAEILWDVDSTDSRSSPPAGYREVSAEVRRSIRPGSIVLMHENRGQTIRALRGILPALRHRGLRSVTVPELLAGDPPSIGQLLAGRRGCRPPR